MARRMYLRCEACNGTGTVDDEDGERTCKACNGKGERWQMMDEEPSKRGKKRFAIHIPEGEELTNRILKKVKKKKRTHQKKGTTKQ